MGTDQLSFDVTGLDVDIVETVPIVWQGREMDSGPIHVGLGEPRETESLALKQERRRNKELERELHRKDKALAETAALLVLRKKLAAIFHEDEDA